MLIKVRWYNPNIIIKNIIFQKPFTKPPMTTTFITFLLLICWVDCGWNAHDDIRTGTYIF
jgi:hypothetical protein